MASRKVRAKTGHIAVQVITPSSSNNESPTKAIWMEEPRSLCEQQECIRELCLRRKSVYNSRTYQPRVGDESNRPTHRAKRNPRTGYIRKKRECKDITSPWLTKRAHNNIVRLVKATGLQPIIIAKSGISRSRDLAPEKEYAFLCCAGPYDAPVYVSAYTQGEQAYLQELNQDTCEFISFATDCSSMYEEIVNNIAPQDRNVVTMPGAYLKSLQYINDSD